MKIKEGLDDIVWTHRHIKGDWKFLLFFSSFSFTSAGDYTNN